MPVRSPLQAGDTAKATPAEQCLVYPDHTVHPPASVEVLPSSPGVVSCAFILSLLARAHLLKPLGCWAGEACNFCRSPNCNQCCPCREGPWRHCIGSIDARCSRRDAVGARTWSCLSEIVRFSNPPFWACPPPARARPTAVLLTQPSPFHGNVQQPENLPPGYDFCVLVSRARVSSKFW